MVSVKVAEPEFEGQTKTRLGKPLYIVFYIYVYFYLVIFYFVNICISIYTDRQPRSASSGGQCHLRGIDYAV